ncbi:1,4-beta-xylanase [Microbacterium bovistercoris]|uniref:1,4-beta-xylanase n=1 Tax=Microbacterium bovistercoris TaxID=2293570 RepID=A0A371NX06_9MICO|nr:family 43 glycosylhydrolase [Microbacterium bovistercoris]REJ07002.1 1,4-beta-xylanase [Microbacterium bovistercoris]
MSPLNRGTRVASLAVAGLLTGAGLIVPANAAEAADEWDPDPSYTSTDQGDGTYTVPGLNADVPDVSVERVPASENDEGRDVYYMISTTMQLSPGAPIMKSYDLVNWQTVNYVYDRLDVSDAYSLRNGSNSYGQGQWASSLRYHDGTYYVLVNSLNLGGAYIYRTDDIENGAWERTPLGRSLHDPSLFFDDANGGTPYIVYGGVSAVRLNDDLTAIDQEYPDIIPRGEYAGESYVGSSGLFEGAQAFYIDGYYYVVMITWPASGRQVAMFRSRSLLGHLAGEPYESRGVLNSNGFAQGSLVPVADGDAGDDWYGFFFRDTFPIGRIPALIPATWNDGWPTFGDNGVVPVNGAFAKPIRLTPEQERFEQQKSIVASDDFRNDAPHRAYQDQQWELPQPPQLDESLIGVELLDDADAEAEGTAGWISNEGAALSKTPDARTGASALAVTGRTLTGSGPAQNVTDRLQHGVEYEVSAWVKYDNPASPATRQFVMTVRYGGAGTKFVNVTPAAALTRGQWGRLSGTFTVPVSQPLDDARLFIETTWTANPAEAPDTHLMDFTVDDASLVGHPISVEAPHPDEVAPNGSNLDLAWEWNHAPDNRYWSLTDRDGWLRLTNGKVVTGAYQHRNGGELTWLEEARNTLSQRTFGPRQSVETKLDVSGMKDGDVAGLAAYNRDFSYVAVKRTGGVNTVGVVHRGQPFAASVDQAAVEGFVPGATAPLGSATEVHLKADLDFESIPGQLFTAFSYSLDGVTWQSLGQPVGPLRLDGGLTHFMGHRVGLFSYATKQTGGHVDVDHFLLSDTLTAQGLPLDESTLDAAIAHAGELVESEYPADAWAAMQDVLQQARVAKQSPFGTQNQIDAPERALSYQLARLGTLRETPAIVFSVDVTDRCVAGKFVHRTVKITNGDAVDAVFTVSSEYGDRELGVVTPGADASAAINTRRADVPPGEVIVTATATVGGESVQVQQKVSTAEHRCG